MPSLLPDSGPQACWSVAGDCHPSGLPTWPMDVCSCGQNPGSGFSGGNRGGQMDCLRSSLRVSLWDGQDLGGGRALWLWRRARKAVLCLPATGFHRRAWGPPASWAETRVARETPPHPGSGTGAPWLRHIALRAWRCLCICLQGGAGGERGGTHIGTPGERPGGTLSWDTFLQVNSHRPGSWIALGQSSGCLLSLMFSGGQGQTQPCCRWRGGAWEGCYEGRTCLGPRSGLRRQMLAGLVGRAKNGIPRDSGQ